LIADMSSNMFTRHIPVSKYGLIFAGAQKNFGPAGCAMVIVRDDSLGKESKMCPTIWNYANQVKNNSNYNTPPVFTIYMINLVLDWIISSGGLDEMDRRSEMKSQLIYNAIDSSNGFYHCPVEKKSRSRVNIPFRIPGDDALENLFLKETAAMGMLGLKGHRSVGGIRASLYNAITVKETEHLKEFMQAFYEKHHAK